MREAQDGDAASYDHLMRAILQPVRLFVMARIRRSDIAEDVVQNVLLSVHRSRHTYDPSRPFSPWLRAVGRNAITDSLRASGRHDWRHQPLKEDEIEAEMEALDHRPERLSPIVLRALGQLSDTQRQAVELLHLRGLSVAEVAKEVGASPSAIKVRAHRGRLALRRLLRGKVL